jgi:hypothetical protein
VIEELGRELLAVGIRGRLRARILAEFSDHIACDPRARLGDPRPLAAQFADDLATERTRRTALGTFAALAVVAVAVGIPQLTLPATPDLAAGRSPFLIAPALLALVFGAQIAFVAGSLAALRALRLGGVHEVGLVRRRVDVALAAGVLTALGGVLYAVNFSDVVPTWWTALALAAAAAGAVPLGAAAFAHARTHGVKVSTARPPAGLSADLGPLAQPALIGAAATFAIVAATAVLEGSLVEGALRGAFEAAAFAACFAALRRPLALTG